MKVLIVGGGGREHALAWAVSRSPKVTAIYAAPGNGGTADLGTNLDISATDIDALLEFARGNGVDLVVVGPEAPLVDGIVDRFEAAGIRCYGPRREAARLEGSKVFAKEFMKRHGVPTAAFEVFHDADAARAHVAARNVPMVIKADGLAAGKGVYVVDSNDDAVVAIDEIMVAGKFGEAGACVIVEDCLVGEEVSVHAVCAGSDALILPSSQDHKRAFDGDSGPNTGGMGAYSPVPGFGEEELSEVRRTVIEPTLRGMSAEGSPFSGTLYAGLMRTESGPMVLEFNVRFGDPETEVLMPMIRGDVFDLLYAAAGGDIPGDVDVWPSRAAATVVMAADGYPGGYDKGMTIAGLEDMGDDDVVAFHAGTARSGDSVVTSGGRVLAVTAWNGDIRGAVEKAYGGVSRIRFDGAFWRRDIGHRAL